MALVVVPLLPFGTPVAMAAPQPVWYLAEGSTAWGFGCEIDIENPNTTSVTVRVTYMTPSGPVSRPDLSLYPESVTYLYPRGDLGEADFSTRLECLEGKTIAVDRTMFWMGGPIIPESGEPLSMETHSSVAVSGPATTWYLPEGSSNWGFETWLLIQNPNASAVTCDVTYMIEGVGPAVVQKTVPGQSRASYNMKDDVGAADASIQVDSPLPVIPERAMYRNERRMGHESIGTTNPAVDYYLAEGTTAWGFTTFLLIQNPNAVTNQVDITYMKPSGPTVMAPIYVPARSRKTIRVNDWLPDTDLSIQVHGSLPLVAERAMYWGADTIYGEVGHDSIGMDQPHTTFFLPGGESASLLDTWTLVMNPNNAAVSVEISYFALDASAPDVKFTATIPGDSRQSFNLADKVGRPVYPNGKYGIKVTSLTPGAKIMVERATYAWTEGGGTFRTSGSATIGACED